MEIGKWYVELEDEYEDGTPRYGSFFECTDIFNDALTGEKLYTLVGEGEEAEPRFIRETALPFYIAQ
jgi:hypothetical protein